MDSITMETSSKDLLSDIPELSRELSHRIGKVDGRVEVEVRLEPAGES